MRKMIYITGAIVIAGLLLASGLLYQKYSTLYDQQYEEVKFSRQALVESVDGHIASLEEAQAEGELNYDILHVTSGAVLDSIRGHYYTTLQQLSFLPVGDMNAWRGGFNELWNVLTDIHDVESSADLERHIQALRSEIEQFEQQTVHPNVK
ncbi:hypothetical protein LCM20_09195 [Halobacillus litoralis]|uniref:hypothetical protein n=1 Tax=Halobacillus litoralis TaxID=45668 RepID=UPI001CD5B97C|nr:hypothetical protein [Halobacillus litoralis]MCA0970763.1 hypothetical protein [Halobacillus litoralis]